MILIIAHFVRHISYSFIFFVQKESLLSVCLSVRAVWQSVSLYVGDEAAENACGTIAR